MQYLLYMPLLLGEIYNRYTGERDPNNFFVHMLILAATRHLVGQLGITLSRWPYLIRNYEIQRKGVTFDSVDHSSNW